MTFVFNLNPVADAIDRLVNTNEYKIELDFYDVYRFDKIAVHQPGGIITHKQNNLDEYDYHFLNNYDTSLILPFNAYYSHRRHISNFLTHVVTEDAARVIGNIFYYTFGRDELHAHFEQISHDQTSKVLDTRHSTFPFTVYRTLVFSHFNITEEALRSFYGYFLAYQLLSNFTARLNAQLYGLLARSATLYFSNLPWNPPRPVNANLKDVIETFFLFHTNHRFNHDDEFITIFRSLSRYYQFLSLKATSNEYLVCNNCNLDEVYEYQRAKFTYLASDVEPATFPNEFSRNLVMSFIKSHVYFIHDGRFWLNKRRNASDNTWNFMVE
ncbi:MAG: hypothetical protein ACK4NC_07465, partial [Candidatus Gracilibacteria bacterium]